LRRELEDQIVAEWLPLNLPKFQREHGGKLAAFWHKPKVEVIAIGQDAFDLEDKLREWRKQHASWEQPYISQIPAYREHEKEED